MSGKDQQLKGLIYAGITALFWGFLAIALKVATGIMDSVSIVWFRFVVAFGVLLVYFAFTKPSQLKILYKAPWLLLLAAALLAANYLGFLNGVRYTSPNAAQVIIQIGPISLGLIGFLFFKEKISIRQRIGFLIAGIGLTLFYRENLLTLFEDRDAFNIGVLWVLMAAFTWVGYAVIQKTLVKTWPAQQLNLIIFGLPILILAPFVDFPAFGSLDSNQWGLMLFLGLNTLIAYGCLALALKYTEANKVSVIITMNPIITFISMAALTLFEVSWIEGEVLSWQAALAAFLVIGGGIIAVAFKK